MLFDFALDEVGTIRTGLHEELRPLASIVVTFKTGRRGYTVVQTNVEVRGAAETKARLGPR